MKRKWYRRSRKLTSKKSTRSMSAASILAMVMIFSSGLHSATIGIVGGQTGGGDSLSATIDGISFSTVSGLPADGEINSVAINNSGVAIIAGEVAPGGYYAFINPDGSILNSATIEFPNGRLLGADINDAGVGLIGGQLDLDSGNAYTARISSDGTISPIDVSGSIFINSVSLNNSGVGLVGGEGGSAEPYAAYVLEGATAADIIPGLTGSLGQIYSVDINSLNNGVIGGRLLAGSLDGYVALVTPSSLNLVSGFPDTDIVTVSVAINDSNLSLIGGGNGDAFAGYVAENGDLTSLLTPVFTGGIKGVSINSTGTGLIGGENGGNLYAAFVEPDTTVTPIVLPAVGGVINSTAINDAGVGLIGGQLDSGNAYTALIAPDTTVTLLNIPGLRINSVDLVAGSINPSNPTVLDQVTPQAVPASTIVMYTQQAAAIALETRIIRLNKVWNRRDENSSVASVNLPSNKNSIDRKGEIALASHTDSKKSRTKSQDCCVKRNSVWIEPFANFVYQDSQGSIPKFSNNVYGALLGCDRKEDDYAVGSALGYAYNKAEFSNNFGDAKIHQGMLSLYGTYYHRCFWVGAAVWGGYYSLKNVRQTLDQIDSTGNTHGWFFSPYVELASPWAIDCCQLYYVEPFVLFNWVGNWQDSYTESGDAGLNLEMPNVYNSLLKSEVGLRFYQTFLHRSGEFRLQEKLSYMNLNPTDTDSVNTSFVGSASTFPVATAASEVLNLASGQIIGTFSPCNPCYPFVGVSGQISANDDYQSYFVSIFTGVKF